MAAAIAWAGLDRQAGAASAAGLVGCLWLLTLPGLLAAAGPAYYAFYYTLTAVLFLWLRPLAARHGALRAGFGALVLGLGLIALGCADYARRTGIRPGQAAYFALYQTHLEEAVGYVAEFVRPLTVVACLALPVAIAVLLARAGAPRARLPRRVQPVALGLAGVLLWQTGGASNEVRMVASLATYRQNLQAHREVAASRTAAGRDLAARRTRSEPELHVVVIGECTNRNHMGLYGYPRATTPRLSRMADELVVLTDVIASHSHTMHALPQALTLADVDNRIDFADPGARVLEILKAAGVRTWWLSNQKPMGIWDDHGAVLAGAADRVELVRARRPEPRRGLDARLLPAVREACGSAAARRSCGST